MHAMASQRRGNPAIFAADLSRQDVQLDVRPASGQPFLLETARTGDHLAISYFLQQMFGLPSPRDFQAQLEEPGYTPTQRLVVRDDQRILAHLRLVPGSMHTAGGPLPVMRLCEMAVAPECQRRGWGTVLLETAERLAQQRGCVLLTARSTHAPLFAKQGWHPCGWHSYSYADPREILAELDRRRPEVPPLPIEPVRQTVEELRVRRWKQTEYGALARLYRDAFGNHAGPLTRSSAQWRWLIQREAFHHLHVVVEGKERLVLDDVQAHVLGYAFVHGDRIIELGAPPDATAAREALLTRVCRDAIEQGTTPVRYCGPPDDSLHDLIRSSGGQTVRRECDAQQWRLAKVLDWPRFAKLLLGQSTLPRPFVIETHSRSGPVQWFVVENQKVTCEHALLHPGRAADVILSEPLLVQLLLGHTRWQTAAERLRIEFRQSDAEALLAAVLPQRPLWLPLLEELLA